MTKLKVLLAGESWFYTTTETKGFDQFTVSGYDTEIETVKAYLQDFAHVTHMPAHLVPTEFPMTAQELAAYDLVILSDIGANSFDLHPKTFFKSIPTPNRLDAIAEYVENGGAFGMVGGYMTFQGIEAKGQFHGTIIEEILPVSISPYDDRVELPQGKAVTLPAQAERHELVKDFPDQWPVVLGYNKLEAKPEAELVAAIGDDPFICLGTYGKGKTFIWASDCAPHWLPQEFAQWPYNRVLWSRIFAAVTGKDVSVTLKE